VNGAELEHNLTSHALKPGAVEDVEEIRESAKELGRKILWRCPPSREQSLAITNLEQAAMWAVASIAREGGPS